LKNEHAEAALLARLESANTVVRQLFVCSRVRLRLVKELLTIFTEPFCLQLDLLLLAELFLKQLYDRKIGYLIGTRHCLLRVREFGVVYAAHR
jgi:hypothetical protein